MRPRFWALVQKVCCATPSRVCLTKSCGCTIPSLTKVLRSFISERNALTHRYTQGDSFLLKLPRKTMARSASILALTFFFTLFITLYYVAAQGVEVEISVGGEKTKLNLNGSVLSEALDNNNVDTPMSLNNILTQLLSAPLAEVEKNDEARINNSEIFRIVRDECINDAECSSDEFCFQPGDTLDCSSRVCTHEGRRCVKRFELNEDCNVTRQCGEGLFCFRESDTAAGECLDRVGGGASCNLLSSKMCQDGFECVVDETDDNDNDDEETLATGTCVQIQSVGQGEECSSTAKCNESLYCDTSKEPPVCEVKVAAGLSCDLSVGNSVCVNGLCTRQSDNSTEGVCVEQVRDGGLCRENSDCTDFEELGFEIRGPLVLCNAHAVGLGPRGRCIRETTLIKELGASCNTSIDACDARRNLICDTVEDEMVCVQREGIASVLGVEYSPCTPGSALSSCLPTPTGRLSECRRLLSGDRRTPFGPSQCLAKLEVVSRGEICSIADFAVCEAGTSCAQGPGFGSGTSLNSNASSTPVSYCMEILSAGSTCKIASFEQQCEEGTTCLDGVCTRSEDPQAIPRIFAGAFDDCSDMMCAPGLVCSTEDSICVRPRTTAGSGEPCKNSATQRKVSHFELYLHGARDKVVQC